MKTQHGARSVAISIPEDHRDRRARHSSSLKSPTSGMSDGAIDGVGFSSASITGIESPSVRPGGLRAPAGSVDLAAVRCERPRGELRQLRFGTGTTERENRCCAAACPLPSRRARTGQLVLCNGKSLCYTQARSRTPVRLFPDSSAVEHSTVNRMVAGSNPAPGATSDLILLQNQLAGFSVPGFAGRSVERDRPMAQDSPSASSLPEGRPRNRSVSPRVRRTIFTGA